MRLMELYEKLKGLNIFEKRSAADSLIDVVFENKDLAAWNDRLQTLLGPALKPAGDKPNPLAKKTAQIFGGIRNDQTLFCKTFAEHSLVAMFWPWQNGKCTTCKIFPLDNAALESKPSFWGKLFGHS
jgi:hypothetical protein